MWRPPITCSNGTLRIGPLVASFRRRAHRPDDPRIDGARTRYYRVVDGRETETFDCGGYAVRLPTTRRGPGTRPHGVSVGLRRRPVPNPQWSRLTRRGRAYRARQRQWIAAGRPATATDAGAATRP